MADLKNLTCVCCGGRINRATMRCEYCGTEYEIKDNNPIMRIESFQNPVREFRACVLVDDYDLQIGGEEYMKHATNRLCEKMLPAVLSGMRIRAERDYRTNMTRLDGSLRIVIPKEK